MTRLRVHAAARAKFLHEVRYYEAARPGVGRRFRLVVDQAFERIMRAPESGKPDVAGCRRMRVAGFPFSVVYCEEKSDTVVYAVRPDARKPGYWLSRAQ